LINGTLPIAGLAIPRLLYGTAWKLDSTQPLTQLAIENGFRGIDTANQLKHYDEAAVGRAISTTLQSGLASREQLFLQTKFTFKAGQDHRLPYDPAASAAIQVEQSFASSLQHLGVDFIDSYLLHGPSSRDDFGPADWEAWRAMESIHDSGRVRMLGASNLSLKQLQILIHGARIRPQTLQNRCYAARGWDRRIREFCLSAGVTYQGFSLLTANRDALVHPTLVQIARGHGRSVSEIIFRFALEVGMIVLTGTSNAEHMRQDLAIYAFQLSVEEVARIESVVQTA
jgi:diketogulonate reductase-like aldo/keto reductase